MFFKIIVYICPVKESKRPMEIEKVVRIVTLFLLIATFAVHVASRLMFPEASHSRIPVMILLLPVIFQLGRPQQTEENLNE